MLKLVFPRCFAANIHRELWYLFISEQRKLTGPGVRKIRWIDLFCDIEWHIEVRSILLVKSLSSFVFCYSEIPLISTKRRP